MAKKRKKPLGRRGPPKKRCANPKCGRICPDNGMGRPRVYCCKACANQARDAHKPEKEGEGLRKRPCLGHGCGVVFETTKDKRFCPACRKRNRELYFRGNYHEAALVGGRHVI